MDSSLLSKRNDIENFKNDYDFLVKVGGDYDTDTYLQENIKQVKVKIIGKLIDEMKGEL